MRNISNHIAFVSIILFAAVVAAHLSSGDACPNVAGVRSAAAIGKVAPGDTVTMVCEPGEFGIEAIELSGTLVAITEEQIVLHQHGQKRCIHRVEVISLQPTCD